MERIDYAESLVAMYPIAAIGGFMDNPLCDVVHTKSGPRPVFPRRSGCAYHTIRETSTDIARDEPCHDASSHACDALRVLAEAEAAHMLSSAGSTSNIRRQPVTVRTGFRGDSRDDSEKALAGGLSMSNDLPRMPAPQRTAHSFRR